MVKKSEVYEQLPDWVDKCGGRDRWTTWVNYRASSFSARAKKLGGDPSENSVPVWRDAVMTALHQNESNRYHYSHFPAALHEDKGHPMYPSLDHVNGPLYKALVLESRLVNDMKTIMSETEFSTMVGHLATTMKPDLCRQSDDWRCKGTYNGSRSV